MTVDVEDYFHVSAFDGVVSRAQWPTHHQRVRSNTYRLLDLFAACQVHATFFVLGWVAERHPDLVRAIATEGHELASHGYEHRLVYAMTPAEFREDIRRAKAVVESAIGMPVMGYRAPSFSITASSRWALDILAEQGFLYDASIFPIRHDRYGIPSAPRHPHWIEVGGATILEVPCSTVRIAGNNLPVTGGGYFRQLPYAWSRWAINRLNSHESLPAVFYIHPWELDPEQPRLRAGWLTRVRHYRNLSRTESRLRRLLADFRFDSVAGVILPVGDVLWGRSLCAS